MSDVGEKSDEIEFHVHVSSQIVEVKKGDQILWKTSVSTSNRGEGEENGSLKTPRGWHQIIEKIGADLPLGAILKSRQFDGAIWDSSHSAVEEDLILTRILWLDGMENHNQSSKDRYIYFHGTNHENKIGTKASHGCIRLKNRDMVTLFDYAQVGTKVFIR